MPIPTRTLLSVCAIWLAAAIALVILSLDPGVWWLCGLAGVGLALVDLGLAFGARHRIQIDRHTKAIWPAGGAQTVSLRLTHIGDLRTSIQGVLVDAYPAHCTVTHESLAFSVIAGHHTTLEYVARATERGRHTFGPVTLRRRSLMRLWLWQERVIPTGIDTIRVYPDFARVVQFGLLATDNRLSQIGVLERRRRGEGLEFHQLREYREGDSPRQVDWKASARQGKLISRDYQDERNQQIVFLLDCGTRMRAREGPADDGSGRQLSHFDHTLNAMLLLGYVALKQGDRVGLATFAGDVERQLAPQRSRTTLTALMNLTYDLEPTLKTPDFLRAAQSLMALVPKRSLIILLTNLRDEDEDTLDAAVSVLRRRHLVLVASLRESVIAEIATQPVTQFGQALSYASTIEYRRARQRAMLRLRDKGIRCMDVLPSELPVALVNEYWSMKRSGTL